MSEFHQLEARVGYTFREQALLKNAMTHTSYANEQGGRGHTESNQRLEFLGDSVLGLVVSTYLYRRFPELPEGKMSRLRASVVCESTLAAVAKQLNLNDCLLLGNGEAQTGGREKPSILADTMESLIAAIYLDSDYITVSDVLMNRIGFQSVIDRASLDFEKADYKTILQEHYREPDVKIQYQILGVDGPPHNCVYEAEVTVCTHDGVDARADAPQTAKGRGRSKKDAEQQAAKGLLDRIGVL